MNESDLFNKGFDNRKEVLAMPMSSVPGRTRMCLTDRYNAWSRNFAGAPYWGDKTLPFKTRSMLNIAMLTAISQHHELGVHVRGALNKGVSVNEIRAVLMQTAV